MSQREYPGDGVTILWNSDLCIHSGHCAATLGAVFRPKERPWIDPLGASADDIRVTIDGCPSGALGYRNPDGTTSQSANASAAAFAEETIAEVDVVVEVPVATTITVEADGPLEISGALRMVDARTGEVSEADRVFLCRCGHSARKPFCDGSHRKQGFSDSGNPGLAKPSA